MNAFSDYMKEYNNKVWKQKQTTTHNTLCSQPGCYSNCHMECTLNFTLDPKGLTGCWAMTGNTCNQCHHSIDDHHHYCVMWQEEEDKQFSVDQAMKKKFDDAKDGKEKTEAAIKMGEQALRDLNQVIDNATNELAQLASDYAGLSLSGSFSAQMEKAVRLLKQSYTGMEEKGVGQDQLQKVKESLDQMQKKLDLLKKANQKTQSETIGVRASFKKFVGNVLK
jgi:hypothetical protein